MILFSEDKLFSESDILNIWGKTTTVINFDHQNNVNYDDVSSHIIFLL